MAFNFAQNDKVFAVFSDFSQLQDLQILFDIGPFKNMTGIAQTLFKCFSENQRKEAAKNMAPNVFIALMVNRPCLKYGFDIAKDTLFLLKFFLFECDLLC
jgi:hypothetical protein